MNKKNKLLLSSVGLLLVSGFAATASTFAWFTTVRSASVNFSSATVTTNNAGLEVKFNPGKSYSNMSATGTNNVISLTGANKVTDISGDGVNFFKPVWNAKSINTEDGLTADSITEIDYTAGNKANGYFVDFALDISRTSPVEGQPIDPLANGLKVFLGENTRITPKTVGSSKDEQAVKAARMAVVNSENKVVQYYSPVEETSYKYLKTGTGSIYGLPGFEQATKLAADVRTSFPPTSNEVSSVEKQALIADLTWTAKGDVISTVTLNFRAWIEGTDTDAINSAIGGVFNIELDIYALEVAKQ